MNARRTLAVVVNAAVAASGLLAAAGASALETRGLAELQMLSVRIYNIDQGPDSGGEFRFFNDERQLRALTGVDVNTRGDVSGANLRQFLNCSQLPVRPAVSDARADSATFQIASISPGSVDDEGDFDGGFIWSECGVGALDSYCQANASVSTTATGQVEPGFFNLILGPRTAVELTASSFVEVWLREACLLNCNTIFEEAQLFTQFGPENPQTPGLPDFSQTQSQTVRNSLFYDAGNFGNTGNVFHDSRTQQLRVL